MLSLTKDDGQKQQRRGAGHGKQRKAASARKRTVKKTQSGFHESADRVKNPQRRPLFELLHPKMMQEQRLRVLSRLVGATQDPKVVRLKSGQP